jgi:membrane complex biogenesis BtpA family protein
MVENFHDTPFFPGSVPPETVAAMTLAVEAVMREVEIPVGINVLRNDASASLGIAAATGGAFIRVNVHTGSMFTDQGLLQGQAHETLRKRAALGISVPILADVWVKHATPPPGTRLPEAARDAWFRGGADGIVLTGSATGGATSREEVEAVRRALPEDGRVWVGSGVTPVSARAFEATAHGMIVGSTLQVGGVAGSGVDPARVRVFMEALGRARG